MKKFMLDPCFLFKKVKGNLDGLVGVNFDDTIEAGTETLSQWKKESVPSF